MATVVTDYKGIDLGEAGDGRFRRQPAQELKPRDLRKAECGQKH